MHKSKTPFCLGTAYVLMKKVHDPVGILAGEAKSLLTKKLHSINSLQSSCRASKPGKRIQKLIYKIFYVYFIFPGEEKTLGTISIPKENKCLEKHA